MMSHVRVLDRVVDTLPARLWRAGNLYLLPGGELDFCTGEHPTLGHRVRTVEWRGREVLRGRALVADVEQEDGSTGEPGMVAGGRFSRWFDAWAAKGSGLTAAQVRHEFDEARRAWDALAEGELGEADTLATALMTKIVNHDPFHGSHDEHSAHLILGHVRLRRGDPDTAEHHLLTAARVEPDPSLRSFGPNMSLAQALLQHGRTGAVIDYLDLCSSLWKGSQCAALP